MPRLRLHFSPWPRPTIELADTPNPNCRDCDGAGGWAEDYGDHDTGEYAGTDYVHCSCWDPDRVRCLFAVPGWLAYRVFGWAPPLYSGELPF
ncbi:hypothetical protein AB0I39_03105 [Kitasatospora purpeofusca]|uniref:hypothetical protein n=1 Tax=Kitasatospora purpeofusca TaxID=67352 RepID=UPI0033C89B53